MKTFPILYKRAQTGAPQQWQIFVEGHSFYTVAGQVGGVLTKAVPTVCEGKNIGRANETTPEQQAIAEAMSRHQKKLDTGHVLSLDEIDNEMAYFEPMLAKIFEDEKHKIDWKKGVLVQPKLDGIRGVIEKHRCTTRNGKQHKAIPHILNALVSAFEEDPDMILDGECYNHDLHDDFNKISSLIRKQKPSAADLRESAELAQYHCYDAPRIAGLEQDAPFIDRYRALKKVIESLHVSCIKLVPILWAYSEEEVRKHHDTFVAQGYEGAIVRLPYSVYKNSRSECLLKLKVFTDDEFIIERIDTGRGLKSDMACTVHCTTKSGEPFDATIKAPHAVLKAMLKCKEKYVGKTCTIRYFGLTPDKLIPRFPYMVDIDRWVYE